MPHVKKWLIVASVLFFTFLACCYLLFFCSESISQSETGTTIFLIVSGMSLFGWPIAFIKLLNAWAEARMKNRLK